MAAAKKKVTKKVSAKKTAASRPKLKAKAQSVLPTPEQLATSLGVTITPALKLDQSRRLRRALPGYVGLLDDVAALLEADAGTFEVPGVTPAALLEAQAHQKFLTMREGVAQAVYRTIYEQRLQGDDVAMKMLEKVARRVNALQEDDASLTTRYKLLLDFLSTFRTGGGKPAAATESAPTTKDAAPANT